MAGAAPDGRQHLNRVGGQIGDELAKPVDVPVLLKGRGDLLAGAPTVSGVEVQLQRDDQEASHQPGEDSLP